MRQLLGISAEFYGMEFYKDYGNFIDKNGKELFHGIAYVGNKGTFYTSWGTNDIKSFNDWLKELNTSKDKIGYNTWRSTKHSCTNYMMHDSVGKFVEWYKDDACFNDRVMLSHVIDGELYDQIEWHNGEEIEDYQCDSGYHGFLPDKIIFFNLDYTYDLFEKDYRKGIRDHTEEIYDWSKGKYTRRIADSVKSGDIDMDFNNDFIFTKSIKKNFRKKTKEKVGDNPRILFDQEKVKSLDLFETIAEWKNITN